MILLWVGLFCCFSYCILMLLYAYGWRRSVAKVDPYRSDPRFISVIIPARNEADNIAACLQSILENSYPSDSYEVIVVDDHSEDDTASIVDSFNDQNVKCLRLADYMAAGEKLNAFKKKALDTGISEARGEIILTTDADCIVPKTWLRQMNDAFGQERVMVAAPVKFSDDGSVLQIFQCLDFMTLQGITVAARELKLGNMCNGANLGFTKQAFHTVDGYRGDTHLASGDDFLLMVKLDRMYKGRLRVLPSEAAIVTTAPQKSWKGFFRQRIRWASKSGKYQDHVLTFILLLIYGFNACLFLLAAAGLFEPGYWQLLAGLLMLKTSAELFFLVPVARFFGSSRLLLWFPLLQPLHIFYIVLAGFLGFWGNYEWKGRKVH
ncbi:MAG: glycosyltransferase [Sphingobacteriales bacterium]|nr:MAG: glycosyltransferase [Sphingobacteriales bacterium]